MDSPKSEAVSVVARRPATIKRPVSRPQPAEVFAIDIPEKPKWQLPTRQDWQTMTLDDAHALIQRLCASYKEGADILNQRVYDQARESGVFVCLVCRKKKPQTIDNHPNYVWRDDRRDPVTGLYETRYICSSECYFRGSNSGQLTNAKTPGNVHK